MFYVYGRSQPGVTHEGIEHLCFCYDKILLTLVTAKCFLLNMMQQCSICYLFFALISFSFGHYRSNVMKSIQLVLVTAECFDFVLRLF